MKNRTDNQRRQTAVRVGRLPGAQPTGDPAPRDLGSFELLHFDPFKNPHVGKR